MWRCGSTAPAISTRAEMPTDVTLGGVLDALDPIWGANGRPMRLATARSLRSDHGASADKAPPPHGVAPPTTRRRRCPPPANPAMRPEHTRAALGPRSRRPSATAVGRSDADFCAPRTASLGRRLDAT